MAEIDTLAESAAHYETSTYVVDRTSPYKWQTNHL